MPFESGIRSSRLEWVREDTEGTPPTDPSWSLFSDAHSSSSPSFSPVISERRKVGDYDLIEIVAGAEDHEWEVTYDLQQQIADGTEAAYDGMARLTEGELPSSHTIVERNILGGTGTAGGGSRLYYVATGALVNSVDLSGEPESGEPIQVTLGYMVEKLRPYKVDQPSSGTTLDVVSTSANDTSQTLTIEDDGAGTSEDVSLNGTTTVTTTATFSSIDAARLSAECEGDVTISDGSGNTLMTIYGSSTYQEREGDLGVPALGSGSHASAIGSSYEIFLGDTVQRGGNPFMNDVDINSIGMTVENNIESTASHQTIGKRLSEGPRDISVNASIFGEKASYDSAIEHLQINASDIVWTLTNTTLTVADAVLTDVGTIDRETDLAVMVIDNTFTGQGLTIA